MSTKKPVRKYDETFHELVEQVSRGLVKEVQLDNEAEAYSTRQEFYAFRSALRELTAQADKITTVLDGKRLVFKREESVYVNRLKDITS